MPQPQKNVKKTPPPAANKKRAAPPQEEEEEVPTEETPTEEAQDGSTGAGIFADGKLPDNQSTDDPSLDEEEEIDPEALKFPMPQDGWHDVLCTSVRVLKKEDGMQKILLVMKIVGGEDDGLTVTGFEPRKPQEGDDYTESVAQAMRRKRILYAFGATKWSSCVGQSCKISTKVESWKGVKSTKIKRYEPIGGGG